jgi:hypothetical protein
MTVPDVFILMLPFLLIVIGEIVEMKGAGIAFSLMAAFSAWMLVAYPQMSAATSASSTEYIIGITYLVIGVIGAVLAVSNAISLEGGDKR